MATDKSITSLNVSLPESMKAFVVREVADGGYTSASEYVRELVRRAKKEREEQESLEKRLIEGLDAPGRSMTAADWAELRESLRKKVGNQRKSR
jgi:antitoxin ParD1/3/4